MGGNWEGLCAWRRRKPEACMRSEGHIHLPRFVSLSLFFVFFIQNIVYVNTQLNTDISVLKQTIFDREMIIKKKKLLWG
jgi:hypothetical protein